MSKTESNKKTSSKPKPKFVVSLMGIIAALVAVIALLLRSTGLGMGTSFNDNSGQTTEVIAEEQTQPAVTESSEIIVTDNTTDENTSNSTSSNLRMIVVANNIILIDEFEAKNSEEFKEYLLNTHTDGMEYIINDNKAIKSTYDEVKQILESYNYTYSETVQ